MADSVVTFLLQNLPQLLIQEQNFLAGVEDQVNSLHKELKLINAFLKDSEGKRNEHEIVKEVVRQIRDVAHKAEDAIDNYIYKAAKEQRRNLVEKVIHFIKHKATLHDIGRELEVIKVEINQIYSNIDQFGIKRTEAEASMDAAAAEALHNRRRYVEEDDVVGFVQDSTKFVKQLTEGKLELDVSSIIGMGGLGKTTLARKVYNNFRVKSHFNCRVWVYASQDIRSRELLIQILKSEMQTSESEFHLSQENEQSKKKLEDMTWEELKDKLEKYLRGKKYLIVMDDVWKTEVWNEVKIAFPDNSNGSRILITSRETEVASNASRGTPAYSLPFLNKDESWELLRKKVFRGDAKCPPEFENLGRKIAESCDGLPLSIVVLGGLLAKEGERKHNWEKYIGNVTWFLARDKNQCKDILALSYIHLPRYLKPCFLYFGVYPEDYEIPVRELIQLWIAEGFIEIQHTADISMEDVAEIYLRELIDRSLIQVASRRTDGEPKTCRIHDLLRDLCISESEEEKFFEVRTDVKLASMNKARRLSILGNTLLYISSKPSDTSCARSLLLFDQDACRLKKVHWRWVLRNFKLVRVLNFGHAVPYSIPDIEKFIHLKYLRISTGTSYVLPDSICNLLNLETLNARDSSLLRLPIGIWKLQRLRNLHLSGPVSFVDPFHTDVKALTYLQVLSTVIVDTQTASLMVEGKLPNVRNLGICYWSSENESKPREVLETSLPYLRHLQTLKIIGCSELPNSFPLTITKVTLVRVGLYSMTALGNLPKLRILKLQDCSKMTNLQIIAGSFSELEVLKLTNLQISEWEQGKGAMAGLRHLVIQKCRSLTMLPHQELCSMTSLRDVEALWNTLELAGMLQDLQMKVLLKMKVGFKLQIYPPTDDDYYKNPSK